VKVQLPPGCVGFDCKDGTKITANKPGGTVDVEDRHAKAINKSQYADTGMITATGALSFGTQEGRRCPTENCRRLWNNWTKVCHKCGAETVPE
jgi:hypothetical protein